MTSFTALVMFSWISKICMFHVPNKTYKFHTCNVIVGLSGVVKLTKSVDLLS